jgi:hypothetical protein
MKFRTPEDMVDWLRQKQQRPDDHSESSHRRGPLSDEELMYQTWKLRACNLAVWTKLSGGYRKKIIISDDVGPARAMN